jgi:hypothetical protein
MHIGEDAYWTVAFEYWGTTYSQFGFIGVGMTLMKVWPCGYFTGW